MCTPVVVSGKGCMMMMMILRMFLISAYKCANVCVLNSLFLPCLPDFRGTGG